jgi:hypothetical protein
MEIARFSFPAALRDLELVYVRSLGIEMSRPVYLQEMG